MPHSAPICLYYDDWMAAFLSANEALDDDKKYDGTFKNMVTGMGERNQSQSFVDAVNGANVIGDFVLALAYVPDDKIPNEGQKRLAGVAMYSKGCITIASQRTDWAAVEVFICYRRDESCGPYGENAHGNVLFDESSHESLEDAMTYASTVFEYQQRTHHFGVVLVGSWAWLERWDHAGVVRSSTFDYQQDPAKLARFFYRVAHASAEARGHDPTATRVVKGSEDYKILQEWAAKAKAYAEDPSLAQKDYVGKQFVDSLNRARAWWRLRVVDDEHGVKDFLVGKPTFAAPGVVGRGTRGYIGLSISDPCTPFVYLKDCWRVVHERSELEGDILAYLNAQGVQNIPTALYHGDVADQHTVSQEFCTCAKSGCAAEVVVEPNVHPTEVNNLMQNTGGNGVSVEAASAEGGNPLQEKAVEGAGQRATAGAEGQKTQKKEVCRLKTHRHYRLVVKEVGLPLKQFPCGRILVWSIRDAIIAHQDAYEKAKMMHRDISVGNILIIPTTGNDGKTTYQGLLADWELSKRLDDYEKDARHPDRTGTWQFMSVNIQNNPEAQVEIADELESFLHVMIYCAIRYLPHTCENVGDFMYHFFDDGVRRGEAEYACGTFKRLIIKTGTLITHSDEQLTFLRRPRGPNSAPPTGADEHPINSLFKFLLPYFRARYMLAAGPEHTDEPSEIAAFFAGRRAAISRPSSSVPQSSQDDLKALAESIKTHHAIIGDLDMASERMKAVWPGSEDRLPDQLQADYKPNKAAKTREKRTAPDGESEGQPSGKRHCSDASRA
ncbi:hypothetical protein ACG7TL_008729 [Trametes sanguinea]